MSILALDPAKEPREAPKPAPTEAQARCVIEIKDLRKVYDPAAPAVLDGINLSIAEGSIHGIIGRSGAGKSTLVRCLNGLVKPSSGRIRVSDQEITGLDIGALRAARRRIGMIFQHFSLLSSRTAAGNVALPLEIAGVAKSEIDRRVPELLDLVGLSAKANAYPAELSGGQKQRIGIARALALKPDVLLSDEATSALDPETTEQILDLLQDINRRMGLTIVLITHEMDVVRRIADHVTVIEAGRIIESGPTFNVFAFPETETAKSFLSSIVAHELPLEVTRTLRAEATEATDPVLRIIFTGEAAHTPVLSDLVTRFGIRPNILHGRVDYIGGKPLGILTIVAEAIGDKQPAVAAYLSALGLHCEVIGHAVRSVSTGAHRATA
jgi:D-methionine transport system ATP-binding protein